MLIGELADRAEVNPKTIRYYEDIGVLPPPERTAAGYRRYDADDLERLRFVHRAKQLDLRLEEIAEILALRDRGQTSPIRARASVRSRSVTGLPVGRGGSPAGTGFRPVTGTGLRSGRSP